MNKILIGSLLVGDILLTLICACLLKIQLDTNKNIKILADKASVKYEASYGSNSRLFTSNEVIRITLKP